MLNELLRFIFLVTLVLWSSVSWSTDGDLDGVEDGADNCPAIANPEQIDSDRDGLGDDCDADDDGDGIVDSLDPWPLDGRYSSDDNNNGFPDAWENLYGFNGDVDADIDADGYSWRQEYEEGTSPIVSDTDLDTIPDGIERQLGQVPLQPKYTIEVANSHACAIDDDGVKCWGQNGHGQTDVPPLDNPTQVGVGFYHGCALDSNGVHCWGGNYNGQATVPPLTNPSEIAVGADANCAIDDSGVVCWGFDGDNKTSPPALNNPRDLKAGRWQFCVMDDSGLVCWGFNGNRESDIPLGIYPEVYDTGRYSTCAVVGRELTCWGLLSYFDRATYFPGVVIKDLAVVELEEEGLCVLGEDGRVHCKDIEGRYRIYYGNSIANIDAFDDHFCGLDLHRVTCYYPKDLTNFSLNPNFIFSFDPDRDGVSSLMGDEMPFDPDEQSDLDGDGIGDNADSDRDGDGTDNDEDAFPNDPSESLDSDGDGVGDNADAFPNDSAETADQDADGIGDNSDNCLVTFNPAQTNNDSDSLGDECDPDDDNDGLEDDFDDFPLDPTEQVDQDGDGVGDNADAFPLDPTENNDRDLDGVGDNSDNCPEMWNQDQIDRDGDGVGYVCDRDTFTTLIKLFESVVDVRRYSDVRQELRASEGAGVSLLIRRRE